VSAIDRAAEVLRAERFSDNHRQTATLLAEEGLLVTDEIQAVLDAAVAIHDGPTGGPYVLHAAVDAYLATKTAR
jgi:hypothetical protein